MEKFTILCRVNEKWGGSSPPMITNIHGHIVTGLNLLHAVKRRFNYRYYQELMSRRRSMKLEFHVNPNYVTEFEINLIRHAQVM